MAHQLTVVIGPARCGKTHRLVALYRQVLRSAGGAVGRGLWLSPTARGAAVIRQQLLAGELPAILDPGITTFATFGERVLAVSPQPPRQTTPLLERTLLRRVIASALENRELHFLQATARRSSFVELLADHIHELKRHGITPAGFAYSIGHRGEPQLHAELARLYTRYEQLLAEHRLSDQEGRQWAVRDALAADATRLAELELVVADGFNDFTHTQLEILGQLARRAGRLFISLPAEAERTASRSELFAKTQATFAELRRLHPQLTVDRLPCRATQWPALDHIAGHLFDHPRDIPPPSPEATASLHRLEIVAAASVQDEIVQLARNIKQRLVNQRTQTGTARPGEMVVVFRSLREAAPRVREVFEEFGIPYSLEAGLPLAATGIVRTLLDVFRLDLADWPFRRVTSLVTNNLLTAVDRRRRAAAEWLVRDLQIAQGREKLIERVQKFAGELASESGHQEGRQRITHHARQTQAAATALPFLQQLTTALDGLPTSATPTAWLAALQQLGERLGIRSLTSGWLGTSHSGPPVESENTTAWRCVAEHFASLERLADWLGEPSPQLSRAAVLDLLVDLARHELLPRPFDDVGRVRVLSAATARTVDAKHILLAGMSEQAFPSPERAGNFYSAADYRFFAVAADPAGIANDSPSVTRAQEEMLLFYEVLTRAGQRLTLSYPALDNKAQSLSPSPYVTEVERAISPAAVTHHRALRPSPLPTGDSPLSPADWRIQAVHEAMQSDLRLLAGFFRSESTSGAAGCGVTGSASAGVAASALEAALRMIASRSRRTSFGPAEGLLESNAVRARLARRFGSEHHWSPSQWETYATCPFKFFMNNVLGREPLGELVLETNHRHRGTLVHRLLAELHRRLPDLLGSNISLSACDAEQFASRFDNLLEALVRATPHTGLEAALIELDRREIEKWGARYQAEHGKYEAAWAQLDGPLVAEFLEWRFGPPHSDEAGDEDPRSTSEPFLFDLGDEKIRITGRIDRIDVGQAAGQQVFNVIDYKSGKATGLKKEHLQSGQRLQPALYVLAAQQLLFQAGNAVPVFAGYWSMAEGAKLHGALRFGEVTAEGAQPTIEWINDIQPQLAKKIKQFVSEIRAGNFPVDSRDEHCTSLCEFSTVCRIGQLRSLGKQWFAEEANTGGSPGTSSDGSG